MVNANLINDMGKFLVTFILCTNLTLTLGYAPDTILPSSTPKSCSCADWSSNSSAAALFSSPEAAVAAGSSCAIPSLGVSADPTSPIYNIYDGFCLCDSTSEDPDMWFTHCDSPADIPSQLNLLIVDASTVAVNFLTSDNGKRSSPSNTPVAELKLLGADESAIKTITGFSEPYAYGSRVQSYHNVIFSNLTQRTDYEYRVATGADQVFTKWTKFRSLYTKDSKPTKLAMYGDMGVYPNMETPEAVPSVARHNIGNLIDDYANGDIDFVMHCGDHAYEFQFVNGERGDGYMDAYSLLLKNVPWLPGWGNHEYLDEDMGERLANITSGMISSMPEGSHRMWYSTDVGHMHLVQLDFSPYFCFFDGCEAVDTCGLPREFHDPPTTDGEMLFDEYRERILAWLEADLKKVDREKTPWLIVSSHFPIYSTYDGGNPLLGEGEGEEETDADNGAKGYKHLRTTGYTSKVQPSQDLLRLDLEPLLKKYNVDVYFTGHNHNYETTWPMFNATSVQKDFKEPKATVHIISGAAGPGGYDNFTKTSPEWSREPRVLEVSYSVVEMTDETFHLKQIANNDGRLLDDFTITKKI